MAKQINGAGRRQEAKQPQQGKTDDQNGAQHIGKAVSPNHADNRKMSLAGLLNALEEVCRQPFVDGDIAAGILMGENRSDLVKVWDALTVKRTDHVLQGWTLPQKETFSFRWTAAESKISFILKRLRSDYRCTYPLRKQAQATAKPDDSTKSHSDESPADGTSNKPEFHLPHAFIFEGFLNKSANTAAQILANEKPIPRTWLYWEKMEIILYLAFFHTPIEELTRLLSSNKPTGHADPAGPENFGTISGLDQMIRRIVLQDAVIQQLFCRRLFDLINEDSRFNFMPDHSENNRDTVFGQLMYGSESTRHLLDELQHWHRQVREQHGQALLTHTLGSENEAFRTINAHFLDWLREMVRLALYQDSQDPYGRQPHLLTIAYRICLCVRQFPEYGAFIQLLLVVCFVIRAGQIMSYARFNQIYQRLSAGQNRIVSELDCLIKGDRPDMPPVLMKLADALFVYQAEQDIVMPRFPAEEWLAVIFGLEPADRALYLPAGWPLQEAGAQTESLRQYHSFDPVMTRDWFLACQTVAFAENGLDKACQSDLAGTVWTVRSDFTPVFYNGHMISPPPKYAGLCYRMRPVQDLNACNQLLFSICSPDNSIRQIKVEIKNTDRRDQDVFHFSLSDQWTDYVIDLERISDSIRSNVEEICFVLTLSSFAAESLAGSFLLRDIRAE